LEKPNALVEYLPSGRTLIRFDNLYELFWYDDRENNPHGIGVTREYQYEHTSTGRLVIDSDRILQYKKKVNILTEKKQNIINRARKDLIVDKDFLSLVYKAKSDKRGFEMSKFGGILSMPHYARGEDKMFKKSKVGAKKMTLNMAFQVGVMSGGDYGGGFTSIIKTILMAQALNISLNIDMFDSDYGAPYGGGYVICNVAKSSQKLNLKNILACSHREFFDYSLFNGYSASSRGCGSINGFLPQEEIKRDLASHYDIIGGNMLKGEAGTEGGAMMSKILKIAWK